MNKSIAPASGIHTGYSPASSSSRLKAPERRLASCGERGGGDAAGTGSAKPACATYATLSDIETGVAGGLGLLHLSELVLDLEVVARFRDAVDESERLSFAYGLGAVRTAVLASRFAVLIVSSPLSLGTDRKAALATFAFLRRHGIDVFSGCSGFVDRASVGSFYGS